MQKPFISNWQPTGTGLCPQPDPMLYGLVVATVTDGPVLSGMPRGFRIVADRHRWAELSAQLRGLHRCRPWWLVGERPQRFQVRDVKRERRNSTTGIRAGSVNRDSSRSPLPGCLPALGMGYAAPPRPAMWRRSRWSGIQTFRGVDCPLDGNAHSIGCVVEDQPR